jgi:FKBP-type peptidyl-prolyl cis-trans isomerase
VIRHLGLTLALLAGMALATGSAQEKKADPDPKPKIVTTDSGLKYQDLKEGKGAAAKKGDTVEVHYTGWLAKDNKKFDSSVDRGKPFSFPLGAKRVIQGWDEGVAGMKVGGKRKLQIPSRMGYGARGSPPSIPPDADLEFDIELLAIVQ